MGIGRVSLCFSSDSITITIIIKMAAQEDTIELERKLQDLEIWDLNPSSSAISNSSGCNWAWPDWPTLPPPPPPVPPLPILVQRTTKPKDLECDDLPVRAVPI